MDIVYERVCGLDIHKNIIAACMIKKGRREHRQFGTMTDELLSLSAWLQGNDCQMVAMESTGSYWKPIYNILEAEKLPVMVANAQNIKAVPGRKTDVKDAEWIADLLRHGLINASFIPPREWRDLRELVRYRKSLIEERAREFNRIQKVLEGSNIKLGSVISDIDGKTGCNIIDAIISGVTTMRFSMRKSKILSAMTKPKQNTVTPLKPYNAPKPLYLLKYEICEKRANLSINSLRKILLK